MYGVNGEEKMRQMIDSKFCNDELIWAINEVGIVPATTREGLVDQFVRFLIYRGSAPNMNWDLVSEDCKEDITRKEKVEIEEAKKGFIGDLK